MSGRKRSNSDPAGSPAKRLKPTAVPPDASNGQQGRPGSAVNDGSSRLRDSVGPAFEAAPTVSVDFVNALSSDSRYSNLERHMGIWGGNNHCYRNAVLTAFLSPAIVMRYLIRWHYHTSNDEFKHIKYSIITRLARLSRQMFRGDDSSYSIYCTVRRFWRRFCYETHASSSLYSIKSWRDHLGDLSNLQETEQQDAHEFFSWLVTAIRTHMSPLYSHTSAPSERFDWVFYSRFVFRSTCGSCRYQVSRRTHVTSDPCLSLNIPETLHKSATGQGPQLLLTNLIDDAMRTEVPDRKCPRCGKKSTCREDKKFQHAPALLTLAISRGTTRPGEDGTLESGKNMSAVTIPYQLDISRHLNTHEFGEGSSVTYSLSSVVSHRGTTLEGGHYVSYIRAGTSRNQWIELDDASATVKVLSDFDESRSASLKARDFRRRFTPYILFYERNFVADKLVPGRAADNVGEGDDKDEQPTHWTGTVSEVAAVANDTSPRSLTAAVNDLSAVNSGGTIDPDSNADAGGNANAAGDAGTIGHTTNGGKFSDGGNNNNADNINAIHDASLTGDAGTAKATSITGNADAEGDSNEAGDGNAAGDTNDEGAANDVLDYTEGAEGDERFPPAVLLVTITIGGVEVQLPRHILSQFRWGKSQDIKIDARLRIPKGECKRVLQQSDPKNYVEANLSNIQHEAYYFERRERETMTNRIQKKQKPWNKFWIKVSQGSDDLTLEQTKAILRATNRLEEEEVTQIEQEGEDAAAKRGNGQDDAVSGRSQ